MCYVCYIPILNADYHNHHFVCTILAKLQTLNRCITSSLPTMGPQREKINNNLKSNTIFIVIMHEMHDRERERAKSKIEAEEKKHKRN